MFLYIYDNSDSIFLSKMGNELFISAIFGTIDTFFIGYILCLILVFLSRNNLPAFLRLDNTLKSHGIALLVGIGSIGIFCLLNYYGASIISLQTGKPFADYYLQVSTILISLELMRIAAIFSIVLILVKHYHVQPVSIGWHESKMGLLKTIALSMLALLLYNFVTNIFIRLNFLQSSQVLFQNGERIFIILDVLIAVIVIPIAEEAYYRGILTPAFASITGWFPAIVFQAMAFMFSHNCREPYFYTVFFFFGLISGYWFYKSKSIYPCILLHSLTNAFITILNMNLAI